MREKEGVSSFHEDVDAPHGEYTYEEIETMPDIDGCQEHDREDGQLQKYLYAVFLMEVSLSEELLRLGVEVIVFPGDETSCHHVTENGAPRKVMSADSQ